MLAIMTKICCAISSEKTNPFALTASSILIKSWFTVFIRAVTEITDPPPIFILLGLRAHSLAPLTFIN